MYHYGKDDNPFPDLRDLPFNRRVFWKKEQGALAFAETNGFVPSRRAFSDGATSTQFERRREFAVLPGSLLETGKILVDVLGHLDFENFVGSLDCHRVLPINGILQDEGHHRIIAFFAFERDLISVGRGEKREFFLAKVFDP